MIHHITLSQLRTFTPPATQFRADNEPYIKADLAPPSVTA